MLKNQSVSMRISILRGAPGDTVIYTESHKVTTDQSGLASVEAGEGTDRKGNFNTIEWNSEKHFLKVEIDERGGSDYREVGISQIIVLPGAESNEKAAPEVREDKLFISRKYVGIFMDFRHTGPKDLNGPNIIWIKTNLESKYGKISAYGKKCQFKVGDKLYIRRMNYSPGGVSSLWVYQIENDNSVYYRLTDLQYDNQVPVDNWFK